RVAIDLHVGNRSGWAARGDAATVTAGSVVREKAVGDDQAAGAVRVAKAAAGRVRRVIQKGTVGDRDHAITVVANAAAVAGHGECLVIAHDRAIYSQVRTIR